MGSRARVFVAPAYLFACLVLGGSAQGIWQNMLLQLAGIAIIAWAAVDDGDGPIAPSARQLLLLAALTIAVVALQLVPLPAAIWTHLGPRQAIAEGYRALGLPLPPEPISLTPAASLSALLAVIPPLAILCAMVRLKAYRPQWLAAALIAGAVIGIVLGALQVASSNGMELSSWYLYEDTSGGKAVGFFANANHMASLLVIAIPFLAAIVAAGKTASMQRYSAIVAIVGGSGLVLLFGLGLNGSLAGYGLALPVVVASLLIILPAGSRLRLWVFFLVGLLVVGFEVALETTPIGGYKLGEDATSSVDSRKELLATTSRAASDYMPFGSGLGSFQSVYRLYEKPEQVTTIYVVHAHNDYAELVLELGFAGIVLMLLFLAWWSGAVWRAWRTAESGPFGRAAAIASAAILVHSLVDFPLRTAAIAACFAMCLALLADSRSAPPKERTELRQRRHVEFK
jgi:O-antigen ligase